MIATPVAWLVAGPFPALRTRAQGSHSSLALNAALRQL